MGYGPFVKSLRTHTARAGNRIRRWWPWLLASFVLHLPFTPLGPLFGLLGLLLRLRADVPPDPVEDLVGIPVELLEAPTDAPPAVQQAATTQDVPTDSVVVTPPQAKPKKPKVTELPDAGLPDASVQDAGAVPEDAGTRDASVADAAVAEPVATDADGGVAPDAGTPERDPFAIAGDFPSPPRTNVNVKLHLFAGNLAKHPAGTAIATLLASEPQWQDFLGPGGLDPIRDISRIAVYGPQLVDSSKVAVFLEYSADKAIVERAVEQLVKQNEGSHIDTVKKKRVAYVNAAGAERAIVFFPGKLIAIVPPGPVVEQLVAMKGLPALPSASDGAEVFQGSLRTPHRVRFFKKVGLEIPTTIAEARAFVSTLPNGGATIELELVDESPESAKNHLDELERQTSALTHGLVTLDFSLNDRKILAKAKLSPLQIAGILSQLNREIEDQRRRARPKPAPIQIPGTATEP